MIAYFILVHRYPRQFKRLFRAIYAPGNQYVIHVDKRSGDPLREEIAALLAPYQGAEMLPSRKMLWGGYSLVDAELRGIRQLLTMDARWSHYINLSGQDFPLKSADYIRDFLAAHPRTQFVRALDQQSVRPDTMNRISHYFIETAGRILRTRVAHRYLSGARPFIGTQWKVLDREFCEFVTRDPQVRRLRRFYRHSFIADEAFFQTVLMNTEGHGEVANDDLRTIDWVPDGDIKLRPRNFGTPDLLRLVLSPDLFARKFDETEDTEILSLLERHLLTERAQSYMPAIKPPSRIPTTIHIPAVAA